MQENTTCSSTENVENVFTYFHLEKLKKCVIWPKMFTLLQTTVQIPLAVLRNYGIFQMILMELTILTSINIVLTWQLNCEKKKRNDKIIIIK